MSESKITDDLVLLYRAAQCPAGTARLKYVADRPINRFDLVASPYGGAADAVETLAWMTPAGDAEAITSFVRRAASPAERARCHARKADVERWPTDALVVDQLPPPEADGIRSACGQFGLDEGAQTFWRLAQSTGWYFRLGQDTPVVDPGSFTLVKRDGTKGWVRA